MRSTEQSEDAIRAMTAKAFPELSVAEIRELNEGMCNALYSLRFSDGSKSVLKIASPGTLDRMSHEMNLMETEVETMRLISQLPQEEGINPFAMMQKLPKPAALCGTTCGFSLS